MMNRIFKMITVGSAVVLACGAMAFACPKHGAGPNAYHYGTPGIHNGWTGHTPHHGIKPNGFRHNPGFNHNPNFNHNHDFKHNSAPKPEGFSSRDFKSKDFNRKPGFNHGHEFNHKPDFNHGHSPDFKPNAFGHKPGFRHNPNFAPAPASTEATTTTENATEQTVK